MITDYQHPQLFKMIVERDMPDDFQAVFRFRSGYGASVILNDYSYGHESGLYELAVIRYMSDDANDWQICCETSVSSDVLVNLDAANVKRILDLIGALMPDALALPGAMLDYES